jgi:hypothetical protein
VTRLRVVGPDEPRPTTGERPADDEVVALATPAPPPPAVTSRLRGWPRALAMALRPLARLLELPLVGRWLARLGLLPLTRQVRRLGDGSPS